MPYVSKAQRGYMHVHHPRIAARWDKEYPNQKNLPKYKDDAISRAMRQRSATSGKQKGK